MSPDPSLKDEEELKSNNGNKIERPKFTTERMITKSVQNFLMKTCFKQQQEEVGVLESQDGDFKYRLGIIDFLTSYNKLKVLENKYNNVRYWNNYKEVSC